MKVYVKYIIFNFIKSLLFVSLIFFSLVLILNILTEVEFFNEIKVKSYFPFYISLLNSPSLLFEMFPFIFLIATQLFFINIFNQNQILIFKYSGLKNSKILGILGITSFIAGILIITLFYSVSSNLKNIYLEVKNQFTSDDKYLAVITNNGLWIKDTSDNGLISIIHSLKIEEEKLLDSFITQFDKNYKVKRYIHSKEIDIKDYNWLILNAKIYENNTNFKRDVFSMKSNFNYEKIQSLFSNLSSLSILELFKLKENYTALNYSTTEVNLQIHKIFSYPIYLLLMTIISSILMFNSKIFKSNILKISFGLFLSVLIYYINNFFMVMGKTEKMSIVISVWIPLLILMVINFLISYKLNER